MGKQKWNKTVEFLLKHLTLQHTYNLPGHAFPQPMWGNWDHMAEILLPAELPEEIFPSIHN